jgi:hypothetical protein
MAQKGLKLHTQVNLCSAVPVIFHVATLMPYKETDQNCNAKKRHIGNNYSTDRKFVPPNTSTQIYPY